MNPSTLAIRSRGSAHAPGALPRRRAVLDFDRRIVRRTLRVAVIGLGYVGLPLALAYARRGYPVSGVDIDRQKVAAITAGRSYVSDVPAAEVGQVVRSGHLTAQTSYASLDRADAIFICVPTPYTRNKEPDTTAIAEATRGIARRVRAGQLIILRSTSYPGTTEELVRPILETQGRRVGRDIYLAFAPERVDPGNRQYHVHNTPAVVGGCDPESTRRSRRLLEAVVDRVISVSSPAAAEMTKLLENVYRNVNIALVNQVAILCNRMGLSVWEIVAAAATKPYGFQSFQPGPGVGGHCIPVDPYYLAWKAREYDFHMDFIELAARVNEDMPYYVATRVGLSLNGHRPQARRPRILLVGLAFKADIGDARDSPAVKLLDILARQGMNALYHDPYVESVTVGGREVRSQPLTPEVIQRADCVVITTHHHVIDYAWIVRHARRVFDTRNATAAVVHGREKITLL